MNDEGTFGRNRDLRERTKMFALRIIQTFAVLPKTSEAQIVGKQLLRSGTSVGANYREASRARSKLEFISKIGDCLKELDESSYWLELLAEAGIISKTKLEALSNECDQSLAIFTSISKKAKTNPS